LSYRGGGGAGRDPMGRHYEFGLSRYDAREKKDNTIGSGTGVKLEGRVRSLKKTT